MAAQHDGALLAQRHYADDGTYTIEIIVADPVITVTGELIEDIGEGRNPYVHLVPQPDSVCDGCTSPRGRCWFPVWHRLEWGPHPLLRLEGTNRTVVYRLTAYDFQRDSYAAEWPD